jgi:hypothetical protein
VLINPIGKRDYIELMRTTVNSLTTKVGLSK